MRDDRSAGDPSPRAAWFAYSPDRGGEHPQEHLRGFSGALQADAYAGWLWLYATGLVQEVAHSPARIGYRSGPSDVSVASRPHCSTGQE